MGSSGGVVPPVKEYWPKIREICTRYDVLLIADEVMTGFGRTGRRFGVDHWDVVPDILVGGKGLTGGYMPMGMIAVKESLVEEVEQAKAEFMFYTYSSHPVACAVADEVLAIMERERLVERVGGSRRAARLELEGRTLGASDGWRHPRHRDVLGNRACSGQGDPHTFCAREKSHQSRARRGGSKRDCSSIRRPGWRGRRVATR